jgi:hypothetical protein
LMPHAAREPKIPALSVRPGGGFPSKSFPRRHGHAGARFASMQPGRISPRRRSSASRQSSAVRLTTGRLARRMSVRSSNGSSTNWRRILRTGCRRPPDAIPARSNGPSATSAATRR